MFSKLFCLRGSIVYQRMKGFLHSPYQVYYRLTNHPLNSASMYNIVVKNTETGNTATSLTRIVTIGNVINPSSSDADFSAPAQFSVKFLPGLNGRIYGMVIRFHYTETDSAGSLSYIV